MNRQPCGDQVVETRRVGVDVVTLVDDERDGEVIVIEGTSRRAAGVYMAGRAGHRRRATPGHARPLLHLIGLR